MVKTLGRYWSLNSEQLLLGQISVNVETDGRQELWTPEMICNGKEKKEAKLELSSFSVTSISERLILDLRPTLNPQLIFEIYFSLDTIHSLDNLSLEDWK